MPIRPNDAPLIVTALLDDPSFQVLDGLRRRHFPASLNKVPAHVSLFHQLPGSACADILRDVAAVCRGRAGFVLRADGVRSLGRGVAIRYAAPELQAVRAELVEKWSAWLTPQDLQPFDPHVTIQNKVKSQEARVLEAAMREAPLPDCVVEGLAVWRYLEGPWEAVATCRFGSAPRHALAE